MKLLSIIIFLLAFTTFLNAQGYVFVLVDVSKSVIKTDLSGAKQTLADVLLGNQLTNANVTYGNQQDLAACKLKTGDRLSIIKFGDKATILANSPNPAVIQTIPADVYQQINSAYPTALTDNRTYITLAKAKIAEYAKTNQIQEYKLYLITDNITDDYGAGGKPDYTDNERKLVESYGTTSSGIIQSLSTKIKLTGAINKDYVLEFIPKVDVTKFQLPGQPPPIVVDTANKNATIKLTSFAGGKKDKEIPLKTETVNINWSCSNFPQGGKFTVILAEYDGGKFREVKKDLNSNSVSIKVPDGKFKITVSAQNFTATSDTTCVEVSTGSFGWVIALLIIAIAGGTGYYFWNKRRQDKVDLHSTNNPADDIFSKGSGTSSSTNNSTSSDYF